MNKKKLLVIGHGRHGKDTVCEILRDKYGYSFESSSAFCSKLFIYDQLKKKYNYDSEEQCYADRHNHRTEWYNAISDMNKRDAATLGRAIFADLETNVNILLCATQMFLIMLFGLTAVTTYPKNQ
jgi:hypothetical protein